MSRASQGSHTTLDIGLHNGLLGSMNDPEVTMSNAATNTNFVAHTKALEAAGIAMTWRLLNPKS